MEAERWRQVDELLQAALDREPGERAAFLDLACAGDPALRGEVESLIESYEQSDSFIESPAFDMALELLAGGEIDSLLGQAIGPYEIIARLGTGGMSEVFLARDSRLDRKVALKLLPAFFTEDQHRLRRFHQEARAASTLNHPNIITIFEIGLINSIHFIATEHIQGETLRQHTASGRVEPLRSLGVAVQVASALEAAHAVGIVHRDIKPENIMVRPDGYVKVLDFGLAKLTERAASGQVDERAQALVNTDPGTVMGTASYMSPEQARGQVVDGRTDIFSLGVVLYEMVAGRAPFGAESNSDVLVSILRKEPPPLASFCLDAPPELQRIVSKALRKERNERYQTIGEMLAEMKGLKEELELEARLERSAPGASGNGESFNARHGQKASFATRRMLPPDAYKTAAITTSLHVLSSIKRHKRGASAVLIGLLLISSSAAITYLGFGNRNQAPEREQSIVSIAVLPFASDDSDPQREYLSDGIAESVINNLSQLPGLRVVPRSIAFRYRLHEVDPQEAGRKLGVQAVLTGRVMQRGDTLNVQAELVDVAQASQLWGEQYNRRLADVQAVQNEISREISQKLRLKLTGDDQQRVARRYVARSDAYEAYLKGRHSYKQFTVEGHKKAFEYFGEAIRLDPYYAPAHAGLARLYAEVSSTAFPPSEAMPKAKAAALQALALDASLSEAYLSLALISWWSDWDFPAAERAFKHAIELNPYEPEAYNDYCNYLVRLGRVDEAIAAANCAIQLDSASLSNNRYLALVFYYAHQYDRAIEQARKTLEIDPGYDRARHILGAAYLQKGLREQAITELQKAVNLPPDEQASMLGYAQAVVGRRGEAIDAIAQLQDLSHRRYISPYQIARIYVGLGDKKRAFEWLEKAYEGRSDLLTRMKVDPTFESLYDDPRFIDLARRVGLH